MQNSDNITKSCILPEVRTQLVLDAGDRLISEVPIANPSIAVDVMKKYFLCCDREHCCVVHLDTQLKPIAYTVKHFIAAISPIDYSHRASRHNHNLSVDKIKKIPEALQDPVLVYDSLEKDKDAVVVVTDMLDSNKKPIICVLKPDGNKLLYINNEKSQNLSSLLRISLPECLDNLACTQIIRQSENITIGEFEKL